MRIKHKDTIITIAAGLILIYFILENRWAMDKKWLIYAAFGLLVAGIASPLISKYIHIGWFWLADKLGFVMSKLIMLLIFVIILIPIGALSRLFRKDFMMLKRQDKTYYRERNHLFNAEDLKNPW